MPWGLQEGGCHLLGAKTRGRDAVEGREPYGSLNKSAEEKQSEQCFETTAVF